MKLLISTARQEDEVHGKKYTKEQMFKLPNFSLAVAEEAFVVPGKQGGVVIDNVHGMGQTPDNRNVLYKGCIAMMDVEKILKTFPDMSSREQASYQMLDLLKQGYSIGSPCLYADIDAFIDNEPGIVKLTGHEGRARIWAMSKLGIKEFPMQILFLGYRARHVKNHKEFADWLNAGALLEKSNKVVTNLFKSVLFA